MNAAIRECHSATDRYRTRFRYVGQAFKRSLKTVLNAKSQMSLSCLKETLPLIGEMEKTYFPPGLELTLRSLRTNLSR